MKKISIILFAATILLLSACGASNSEPEANVPNTEISAGAENNGSTDSNNETSDIPAAAASEAPETVVEPEDETVDNVNKLKDIAVSFIGKDVSELYAEIGEPESSDYAPSCLGDGEDGNLYYDGFTVYTYREGGSETVEYVE